MNEKILNFYLKYLLDFFEISKEEFFKKSRDYETIERKQIFYYLANNKGVPISVIIKFLSRNNLNIHHSNVSRGIKKIKSKIEKDDELKEIIKDFQKLDIDEVKKSSSSRTATASLIYNDFNKGNLVEEFKAIKNDVDILKYKIELFEKKYL